MLPPDLAHPEQCLGANLRRAVRAVNAFYDRRMDVGDAHATQFTLVAAINGFGRCTPGELAAWLGMDPTTVTRSVALLRDAGLVESAPGDGDRRTKRLALTPAGRRWLQQALPEWRGAQHDAVALLGPEKARTLLGLLAELTRAAGVDEK